MDATFTESWGMQFNVPKCKMMHLGQNNHQYQMYGEPYRRLMRKRLFVLVSGNLKPAAQCARAAKTVQTVLGQISRLFYYRDRLVFMRLYKQYNVRPHLEFSVQAWSP
jgi:hypothetical protein